MLEEPRTERCGGTTKNKDTGGGGASVEIRGAGELQRPPRGGETVHDAASTGETRVTRRRRPAKRNKSEQSTALAHTSHTHKHAHTRARARARARAGTMQIHPHGTATGEEHLSNVAGYESNFDSRPLLPGAGTIDAAYDSWKVFS